MKKIINHLNIRTLRIALIFLISSVFSFSGHAQSLSGTLVDVGTGSDVTLTNSNNVDWAIWGTGASTSLAPVNRQSGGSGISNLTAIQNGNPLRGIGQFNVGQDFFWSDGTSPASGNNVSAGIQINPSSNQVGAGFSFSVPASTTEQTLTVYLGHHTCAAEFKATLSDGSAPPLTLSVNANGDNIPSVATITFEAGSNNQTLNVSFLVTNAYTPTGNAQVYAATLASSVPIINEFTFSGTGNWTNAGNWDNYPGTTIAAGQTVIIDGDCTIQDGVTTVTNNGTVRINASKKLFSEHIFNNNGIIENSGTLETDFFNNNNGATITNKSGAMMTSHGDDFKNNAGAEISNEGTLINVKKFTNNGTVNHRNGSTATNDGEIINGGQYHYRTGSTATTKAIFMKIGSTTSLAGNLVINGVFDILGFLGLYATATVVQNDKVYLYSTGTLEYINSSLKNGGNIKGAKSGVGGIWTQNALFENSGTIKGAGTFITNDVFTNLPGSKIIPGDGTDPLIITGDFNLGEADLEVDLDSPTVFNQLEVSGTLTIGANSELSATFNFNPSPSDVFDFVNVGAFSGTFAADKTTITGATLTPVYGTNTISIEMCSTTNPCTAASPLPTAAGTYASTQKTTDSNGWTHYCSCDDELLLSIKEGGTGVVVPNTGVSVKISNPTASFHPTGTGFIINPDGAVVFNRTWDVQPTTPPTSDVPIRTYFTNAEYTAINTELTSRILEPLVNKSEMWFYKANDGMAHDAISNISSAFILTKGIPSTMNWRLGSHGTSDNYAEYHVASFSGGGGGGAAGGGSAIMMAPVPTLGQWGLIILALLLINFAFVMLTAPKLATATGQQISTFNLKNLPFDMNAYGKIWAATAVGLLAIFTVAIQLFGYELTSADPIGALVSSFLVAYAVFTLKNEE